MGSANRSSTRRAALVAAGVAGLAVLLVGLFVWSRPPQMGADEDVFEEIPEAKESSGVFVDDLTEVKEPSGVVRPDTPPTGASKAKAPITLTALWGTFSSAVSTGFTRISRISRRSEFLSA